MDANTILEVTKTLIGSTEPYGDSAIDRERTQNLDKLIYVVDELLYEVEKAAVCKDRYEGSMRMMGEKAHEALNYWWSWIDGYLENAERKKGKWINHRNDDGHNIADCDQCGHAIQWFDGDERPRFCCMCGADLREGEADEAD